MFVPTTISPLAPHSADPTPEHFRQRCARQMPTLLKRLGVPPPEEIYTPNEARLALRPRLGFGDLTPDDLRRRATDPRFAHIMAYLHDFASKAATLASPQTVDLKGHDPYRQYADSLAWMAASILVDTDPARAARTMDGLLRWVHAFRAWGPFENDLVLAQSTLGLAVVYDWLHDELPPGERDAIRAQIIGQVRFNLDENRGSFTMWRGQRFGANHTWGNLAARAAAALTLWGDPDPSLAPGELRAWLDDALVHFWIAKHTHPTDGAPTEGPGYQDYGLRFYLDFATDAEHLLHLRESFFDDQLRALSARLFTLLPGNRGAMVYADGYPSLWGAAGFNFRRLAAHFQDGRAQLVADLLERSFENISPLNWRDLFAYDPDLAPARLEDVPLFCDMEDFGLFTARSDWGRDAAFFGLRCGSASGDSVARALGYDFGEAHAYPNQGEVIFYLGEHAVIPGCNYADIKLTSSHPLVVFEGRAAQAGRVLGQVGEGGLWFNTGALTDPTADYDRRARAAHVLAVEHGANYHHYLCDLGGLYLLCDERVADSVCFPEYLRSVVFLPDGAVAIVDRVRTPVPRTFSFRLPVAGHGLAVAGEGFQFNVGDSVPVRIDDFSPTAFERQAQAEDLPTREPTPRAVASLRAADAREAVFAVVIGAGAAGGRYVVAADERGYALSVRGGGAILRSDWPR